jgi:hypothetical protein
MKVLSFATLLLVTMTSFAAEKPNRWVCDVKDQTWPWPKPSEVSSSLSEPLVTLTSYIQQDNGSYKPVSEELVTAKTVSKWKAERSKCQIQSGFRQGQFVDDYEFFFTCGSIQGSFSIDFRDNTGFYGEQLTNMNVRRSFSLENCRPAN